MTGENIHRNIELGPIVDRAKAMVGFMLITEHEPKSPESRILDEWQYEAAGLRTAQDRTAHFIQRFDEYLAGDESLLGHYIAAQKELR